MEVIAEAWRPGAAGPMLELGCEYAQGFLLPAGEAEAATALLAPVSVPA
jgi:hypothetical protein